ncbi:class I SAM-dependent methyltransferase [Nocardioides caeni]|uniref:Class I SAM-dependent methyltransferase n=1 Tax=Nocardioides caeni TaxID=574700 RepID=A0A4S8N0W9_9ACTN|nr:class I SAM-dependent methyltransferase [Nocardioides caeni]THV09101.1 class I SAM-dependent methyltransferase [Nocardioides caeni]
MARASRGGRAKAYRVGGRRASATARTWRRTLKGVATDDSSASAALSFGEAADAYDRGRPDYPIDAVRWLTGETPLSILELGAGTGKLTAALVELGHDVHATDPDPRMLERLSVAVPEARLSQTRAEEIPAADATYDLVIAGQAFHWFDHAKALPEIARVLKRGGSLALIWNAKDERIPWVKRLGNLIGRQDITNPDPGPVEGSPHFGPVEEESFKHWQTINRQSIQDLVLSRSNIVALPPNQRDAKLAEVLAFYDDFGRGMDGMQLPYVTRCFKAVVGIRPQTARPEPLLSSADPAPEGEVIEPEATDAGTGSMPAVEPPADDDSGMLLIDFR